MVKDIDYMYLRNFVTGSAKQVDFCLYYYKDDKEHPIRIELDDDLGYSYKGSRVVAWLTRDEALKIGLKLLQMVGEYDDRQSES